MIIKKTDIEGFGKFANKSIEFDNGFNLIFGKNEDGKTTFMNFIMMMFYSSSGKTEKGQDLLKIPRKKYRPWDNSAMAGAVEFEAFGKEYRLRKEFFKSEATDKSTILCKTTGEYEKITCPNEAGEHFLAMGLGEFERSVFISSTGGFSSDASADSLAMRIANLSASGDESVSSDLVTKRIDNALCELVSKNGKKGLLVDAKAEIERLKAEEQRILQQMDIEQDLFAEIAELESKIAESEATLKAIANQKKIESATKELNAYYTLNNKLNLLQNIKKQLAQYNKSFAELKKYLSVAEKIECEISNAMVRLEAASAKTAVDRISNEEFLRIEGLEKALAALRLDLETLHSKIFDLRDNYKSVSKKAAAKAKRTGLIVGASFLVLALVFAALGFTFKTPVWFGVGGAFAITAVISAIVSAKSHSKNLQKSNEIQAAERNLQSAIRQLYSFDDSFVNKDVSEIEKLIELKLSETSADFENALKSHGCQTFNEVKAKTSYLADTEISNISAIINSKKNEFVQNFADIKKVNSYIEAKILYNEISDSLKTFDDITADIAIISSATGISDTSENGVAQKIIELIEFLQENPKSDLPINTTEEVELRLRELRAQLGNCQRRVQLPEKSENEIKKLIQEAESRCEELNQRYKELLTASEVMAEAISETNRGLGSYLSKKTAQYLTKISNGRYNNVLVSRSLNVEAQATDGEAYRDWKYLSGGAIDKVYLALRLSATDILTRNTEPLPLLLDDIFMQYDDESCESALKFLKEYLEESGSISQILFFTCHRHIAEMAKKIFKNTREIIL